MVLTYFRFLTDLDSTTGVPEYTQPLQPQSLHATSTSTRPQPARALEDTTCLFQGNLAAYSVRRVHTAFCLCVVFLQRTPALNRRQHLARHYLGILYFVVSNQYLCVCVNSLPSMEDGDIDLAEENARLCAELLAANTQQQQPATQHLVNAVIKIPPFWPLRPIEWFLQAESVFITSHITSERTRFHCVLQQLPQDTITTTLDIIKNQATLADPYTRLPWPTPTPG